MDPRIPILEGVYGDGREAERLTRSRSGQLEYLTTLACIDEYAARPCRVLELGAGTGAYSLTLAREGYDVTALELVGRNVEILRERGRGVPHLTVVRGDALDLGRFEDDIRGWQCPFVLVVRNSSCPWRLRVRRSASPPAP